MQIKFPFTRVWTGHGHQSSKNNQNFHICQMMFPQDWWYSLNDDLSIAFKSFYMVMKSRTSAHDNQIDKYFDTDFQKEMLTFVDTNDIDCIFSQVQLKIIEQLCWISKKVLSHRLTDNICQININCLKACTIDSIESLSFFLEIHQMTYW